MKKSEPIIMCIMSGQGECCIGKVCLLYKTCFQKEDKNVNTKVK